MLPTERRLPSARQKLAGRLVDHVNSAERHAVRLRRPEAVQCSSVSTGTPSSRDSAGHPMLLLQSWRLVAWSAQPHPATAE
jgi:hypothetical protein